LADGASRGVPGVFDVVGGAIDSALIGEASKRRVWKRWFLQAQRMESVGALASALAHDLNSALAPILMDCARCNRDASMKKAGDGWR